MTDATVAADLCTKMVQDAAEGNEQERLIVAAKLRQAAANGGQWGISAELLVRTADAIDGLSK